MYLKSLTLRGFKSFASATTLNLEPGITCVVGPNGSGKSNVVDALSWVMGEQGAKSLRGGKMEDVIFAGTAGRPPLGRAEVSLTIDNTDGALPIEYSEVTISRTMFRGGGSEYTINGTPCRLLDVQELLSDSGIGREMHVIVGQGQLDAVLRATPEERRGFIEEAAGVLKHRKRKEKALRKLEAMQANLTRVSDLTAEIRRQLGPLGRQAEVARKAVVVQTDLRDARSRLLADALVQLTSTLEAEVADETALRARRAEVEQALGQARERVSHLEQITQAEAPTLARAQETWYRLSSLRERLRSTEGVARERLRLLASDTETGQPSGRDPEQLAAQATELREQERTLGVEITGHREVLTGAVGERQSTEGALAEAQQELAVRQRAAADRREGLARLSGQVAARRTRIEAAEAEAGRLTDAAVQAEQRGTEAEQEFTGLEAQVAGVERGEQGLDAEHETASEVLERAEAEVERLRDAERVAERERATWTARREALELGLARKDGGGALLAASDQLSGVLGSVATLLTVEAGHEQAVAAALGAAADAVAVDSLDAAVSALRMLRSQDAGQAGLVVGASVDAMQDDPGRWPILPAGARWARELVQAPDAVRPALERLLHRVAVVRDLDAATALVRALPDCTAVTADGDVLAPGLVRGGSAGAPSLLEVQAAADEAGDNAAAATHRAEQSRFALAAAQQDAEQALERVEAALERLHDSDAQHAAVAERLGQLGSAVRSAHAEADRLRRAAETAGAALEADRAALGELEQRLAAAQEAPELDGEPSSQERDRLDAAATAARAAETEARLALRTAEERGRAVTARAEALEQAVREEHQARERAAARVARRRREAEVANAVQIAATYTHDLLSRSLEVATEQRDAAQAARTQREAELVDVRATLRQHEDQLRELTDSVHRDEVARTQQRLRIETLQAKAVEELGIDPEVLVEEFGPHQLVPPSVQVPGEPAPEIEPQPVPYVREEQEKRLRKAERALALLGRVNPLALEEYSALEERHKFLTEQLADLGRSRTDLLDIVKEVDQRVQEVFTAAYHDTAAQFERVFARLFPGGEGRLVLTDPDDMLTTGIEVEARPPGKKIKRLSLLSGGERSLTAVALLVAIFKARPSPFYVMDEVEAALDDTNLGRLIVIMEELRESSQLIVITHQKRTMEVADALYGVTMRGDGVTTVVSQRLREASTA
ncbi:chromosome segregation protein SMC [Angustibacter sp. McL0619]|uniref:chromosome segregation protein SMC n=1 Tax=Angustibacter sp. McL0619 TaxID=3415676 RepID=UPI003CF63400